MDDLEYNPLYRALETSFRCQFDIARKMSYVIAIPHSDILEDYEIDLNFATSHILMPSKLLKSHFNPLQAGEYIDDIEIDGRKLICKTNNSNTDNYNRSNNHQMIIAKILAQEIGYNIHHKEFRTILIDRVLVSDDRLKSRISSSTLSVDDSPRLFRRLLGPLMGNYYSSVKSINQYEMSTMMDTDKRQKQLQHKKYRITLETCQDCRKYLDGISENLTLQLDENITQIKSTHQMEHISSIQQLSNFAELLHKLTSGFIPQYERAIQMLISNKEANTPTFLDGPINRCLTLAIENYIVSCLHNELFETIRNFCNKEDTVLLDRLRQITKSRLNVCQLGAQEYFSEYQPSDELISLIRQLPKEQNPISIVNNLMKLMDLVTESINQSVEFRRLLCGSLKGFQLEETSGGSDTSSSYSSGSSIASNDAGLFQQLNHQRAVSICSDDLIATLIYSLAAARPENFYSLMKYLELFGWSSTRRDQAEYFTVTLQSVVHYIITLPMENNATLYAANSSKSTSVNSTNKRTTSGGSNHVVTSKKYHHIKSDECCCYNDENEKETTSTNSSRKNSVGKGTRRFTMERNVSHGKVP